MIHNKGEQSAQRHPNGWHNEEGEGRYGLTLAFFIVCTVTFMAKEEGERGRGETWVDAAELKTCKRPGVTCNEDAAGVDGGMEW